MSNTSNFQLRLIHMLHYAIGMASFAILIFTRRSLGIRHYTHHSFFPAYKPSVGFETRWMWPALSALYTGIFFIVQWAFEYGQSDYFFLSMMMGIVICGYWKLFKWERMIKNGREHSNDMGINVVVAGYHPQSGTTDLQNLSNRFEIGAGVLTALISLLLGFITVSVYLCFGTIAVSLKILAVREVQVQKQITINDSAIEDKKTLKITTPEAVQDEEEQQHREGGVFSAELI